MDDPLLSLVITILSAVGLYIFSALEVALFSCELPPKIKKSSPSKSWLARVLTQAGDIETFFLVMRAIFLFIFAGSLFALVVSIVKAPMLDTLVIFGVVLSGITLLCMNILPASAAGWKQDYVFSMAWLIRIFYVIVYPLKEVVKFLLNILLRLIGIKGVQSLALQRQLAYIGEHEGPKRLEEEERKMIKHIIDFGDTTVREIMVPRIDMVCAPVNSTPKQIIELIKTHGHSRIPIYEGRVDNVVGILYAKDLLLTIGENGSDNIDLRKIARRPYFVPESKLVNELMQEFRRERVHIAIVVDEYGGVAGLVTMEDILEEIVGEIQDEYDREERPIVQISENVWLVNGRVSIDEVEEELGIEIPYDEADTIGGLVYSIVGGIPKPGEKVKVDDKVSIVVQELESQRIKSVKVILT